MSKSANHLPGNPHYTLLNNEPLDAGSGFVNAVLALAWEQRTANLIAYLESNPSSLVLDGIDVTVRARLGLKEDPNA